MDTRIKKLLDEGDDLFKKRYPLDSLFQEIADNFYVEAADFTTVRSIGRGFADHLTTSYPLLVRRELGNNFSSLLRPTAKQWFEIHTSRREQEDNVTKKWLEHWQQSLLNAMYDDKAKFNRATKQADHFFATFGQAVLSVKHNLESNALIYQHWHLRDVVWSEDDIGDVSHVHRRWLPQARILDKTFKGNLSQKAKEILEKSPMDEIAARHVVLPAADYDYTQSQKLNMRDAPYVSVHFEVETGHILEETPQYHKYYIIPRWMTLPGSQYSYSPATWAALPDARLLQDMSLVLLEAGQKAVDPPMVTPGDVIRGDLQLYSGGINVYDAEYNEKTGEVLRPIPIDTRGIPLGMEMHKDTREMIAEAFFLNKLNMPTAGDANMTAYEVGQRVQEYIRNALPLFEPMEQEYNASICRESFTLMRRGGLFGSELDMPKSLRGLDPQFTFSSPLHDQIERQKGQVFQSARALIAEAVALDPSAVTMVDARVALRDALDGIGTPAKWIRSEEQVKQIDDANKAKQEAQETLALMQQGGETAKTIGEAGQAINQMQMGAP